MGIFDFFKKKTTDNSGDSLEALLKKAATEPAVRPAFYKKLLTENLLIITDGKSLPIENNMIQKDAVVNISTLADGRIPVFTSTDRMFDQGIIKEQVPYLAVKGSDLFGFIKGATIILNPYSDYGKELLPGEIEDLLSGKVSSGGHQTIEIKKETRMLIGQPAVYPTEMVAALSRLFAGEPAVNCAYIALIQFPDAHQPPHFALGIDAGGPTDTLYQKAGTLAQQFLKPGEFIDVINTGAGKANNYFSSVAPFYKKG